MKTLEKVVMEALECTDTELLPFLPYILQDFWELGTDPNTIVAIITKHYKKAQAKVLDLGCGKGAVSIQIAKNLGYTCLGIDAMPPFIDFAKEKAQEHQVETLCTFEAADIRERVNELSGFDILTCCSIGPVFGTYFETLTTLNPCLNPDGMIIIDDGYIEDSSHFSHPQVPKRKEMLEQIRASGMQLVDEVIAPVDERIKESYEQEYSNLKKRCEELVKLYPEQKELFYRYLKNQETEYGNLKSEIICSTLVIGNG